MCVCVHARYKYLYIFKYSKYIIRNEKDRYSSVQVWSYYDILVWWICKKIFSYFKLPVDYFDNEIQFIVMIWSHQHRTTTYTIHTRVFYSYGPYLNEIKWSGWIILIFLNLCSSTPYSFWDCWHSVLAPRIPGKLVVQQLAQSRHVCDHALLIGQILVPRHMHVHMYSRIDTHAHAHAHIHTLAYLDTCTFTYTYAYTYIHSCT